MAMLGGLSGAPDLPPPPFDRLHPAVRMLDRIIRRTQFFGALGKIELLGVSIALNEKVRKVLVGKPLRAYRKTGKGAKQRRLLE